MFRVLINVLYDFVTFDVNYNVKRCSISMFSSRRMFRTTRLFTAYKVTILAIKNTGVFFL